MQCQEHETAVRIDHSHFAGNPPCRGVCHSYRRGLDFQLRNPSGALVSGEEPRVRMFQPIIEILRGRGHLGWDSVAPFADAAFRAVFDSSAEALLVVNAAGVVQRANPRARELLHLREANLSHSTLDSYLPTVSPQRLSKLGAEDALPLPPMIEAELAGGSPVQVTLRAVLPGSGDMLLCVDSQGRQGQIPAAETEFRAVVESVQAGILLLDIAGGVKFASSRFAEIFGLRKAEIGQAVTFQDLHGFLAVHLRNPVAFAAPWNAFASGAIQSQKDDLEVIEPSGRIVERLSRPVLDSQGRAAGWLELYTDVTIERSIQKKILQTEKMVALGQFVSGIAHELNNPLTTIMGYSQLLSGHGLLQAQLAEARGKVYQEAERARRIVKSLLYFGRENQPQRVLVELNEIVERALSLRSYDLRVRNIAVFCELAPDLPATMADPFQLQQVLLNLLVNAEQALIEGRGHGAHLHPHRRPAGGQAPDPGIGGRRTGHLERDWLPHLRSFLYHQAARSRDGLGAFYCLRNRAATRRGGQLRKHPWRWNEIRDRTARRRCR